MVGNVALFEIGLVGPGQSGVDGKVAVTQVPMFAHQPIAIEADQELWLYLDVVGGVGVVGTDHRIAKIPGMVGKYVGVDVIAERAQ